jgi:hypothetical protein
MSIRDYWKNPRIATSALPGRHIAIVDFMAASPVSLDMAIGDAQ